MMPDANIRKAGPSDLYLLHSLCRKAYTESFASHWNEGGLEWYLEKSFGLTHLREDLDSTSIYYFIANAAQKPAGFMKLKVSSDIGEGNVEEVMEIEKLYCLLSYKGKGLGTQMMKAAISLAREMNKKSIRLGVLDTNYSAIRFYEGMAFKHFQLTRLTIPYFKEELRGLLIMELRF